MLTPPRKDACRPSSADRAWLLLQSFLSHLYTLPICNYDLNFQMQAARLARLLLNRGVPQQHVGKPPDRPLQKELVRTLSENILFPRLRECVVDVIGIRRVDES
jgi:hypothetical protein